MCKSMCIFPHTFSLVNHLKLKCRHHSRSALNSFRMQLLRSSSHLTTPSFYLKKFSHSLYYLIFIPYPNSPNYSKYLLTTVFPLIQDPIRMSKLHFGGCLLNLLKSRMLSLLLPWQGFLKISTYCPMEWAKFCIYWLFPHDWIHSGYFVKNTT